jgi:hypothetical protein
MDQEQRLIQAGWGDNPPFGNGALQPRPGQGLPRGGLPTGAIPLAIALLAITGYRIGAGRQARE